MGHSPKGSRRELLRPMGQHEMKLESHGVLDIDEEG